MSRRRRSNGGVTGFKRLRLLDQGGRCFWCGRVMLSWHDWHPSGAHPTPPLRYATLEHLFPRHNALRGARWGKVLACAECNHERGRLDWETFRTHFVEPIREGACRDAG